jgi:predicted nucleic acid-binding protein
MPQKEQVQQDPIYIPIPVAAEYFYGELKEDEEKITKQKNK